MLIVKHYARKIGLVETIDQMVDTQMEQSPGIAVLAMVLDTLSWRTPLYRLTEFFEGRTRNYFSAALSNPNAFAIITLAGQWRRSPKQGPRRSFLNWPKMR
jgi:Domain of unknown function (DUF4277)